MTKSVIGLLAPNQSFSDFVPTAREVAKNGYTLECLVDPSQAEPIRQEEGLVIFNSVVKAATLFRSSLFYYGGHLIQSSAFASERSDT